MPHSPTALSNFIARWRESGAAERANCQPFLGELCDVLGVERPRPAQADDGQNAYVFERAVTFQNPDGTTSPGRIDLYKRGCFVLEAKQGSDRARAASTLFGEAAEGVSRGRTRRGTAVRGTRGWDVAMQAARGQAERYVRALPAFTLGEVTLASLQAKLADVRQKREQLETLRMQVAALSNELEEGTNELASIRTRALSGFRAVFGPNSTQYEQAGGTRQSEIRRPSRKGGGGSGDSN